MHNHSYENEFNLHVNEISFSYEKMSTKTRFEEEAKGNSEMAYSISFPESSFPLTSGRGSEDCGNEIGQNFKPIDALRKKIQWNSNFSNP